MSGKDIIVCGFLPPNVTLPAWATAGHCGDCRRAIYYTTAEIRLRAVRVCPACARRRILADLKTGDGEVEIMPAFVGFIQQEVRDRLAARSN